MYQRRLFNTAGGHAQLRQKNELLQVYTDEQFKFIQEHLIKRGREIDFRLKVDLNMGHFFCLRSQNRLLAELADIFMIPQAGEGVDGGAVPMLFLLLRQGKVTSASVDFLISDSRGRHSEIRLCLSTL